ncbi:MAG TPA: preprotein translocase K, partial [Pseudomonas sp.]
LPDGELGGYLQTCGLEFWLSAAGDIDSGCARRLRVRLPPGPPSRYAALPAENPALAQALCLKVARQVSPECCHLLK